MSRSIGLAILLAALACGGDKEPRKQPPSPTPTVKEPEADRACASKVTRMVEWSHKLPDHRDDEEAWPIRESGLPVDAAARRVGGDAMVPVRVNADGTVDYPLRPGFDPGQPVRALTEKQRSLFEAEAKKAGRVIILAAAGAPADSVQGVVAMVPAGVEIRRGARLPCAELVKAHAERLPFTPEWARAALATACESPEPPLAAFAQSIAKAAGSCTGMEKLLEMAKMGASLEVLMPGAAELVQQCKCEGVDEDALESILVFLLAPMEKNGWITL